MSSENNSYIENILDRLNTAISELRLKRKEIAEKTGYSASMVSDILNGKVELSQKFIKLISATCGVSEEWVMTGEGDMFMPNKFQQFAAIREAEGKLTEADRVKEAAVEYFTKAGINRAVAEKFLMEFSKLDESSQWREVGKIIDDVADMLREKDRKEKGRE